MTFKGGIGSTGGVKDAGKKRCGRPAKRFDFDPELKRREAKELVLIQRQNYQRWLNGEWGKPYWSPPRKRTLLENLKLVDSRVWKRLLSETKSFKTWLLEHRAVGHPINVAENLKIFLAWRTASEHRKSLAGPAETNQVLHALSGKPMNNNTMKSKLARVRRIYDQYVAETGTKMPKTARQTNRRKKPKA